MIDERLKVQEAILAWLGGSASRLGKSRLALHTGARKRALAS
jgi:hypothetical protein